MNNKGVGGNITQINRRYIINQYQNTQIKKRS